MGLYHFPRRCSGLILSGAMTLTIRKRRACLERPGNTLYLYERRCRHRRLLLEALCVKVEEINLSHGAGFVEVRVNGSVLWLDECEQLARGYGSLSFVDMMEFWKGRLPFDGHIIHWKFPGEAA
jgi:hypothetical protein